MLNFLCDATTTESNGASRLILTGLLIVVLIGMLVMPYFSQKKKNKEYEAMINSLKVGDLVKTAGGVIGRINKIIDKGEIKTIILETGSKTEKSFIEFDANVIYCVLKSTKVENTEENTKESEEDSEEKENSEEENATKPVEENTEKEVVNETAQNNEEKKDEVVKEVENSEKKTKEENKSKTTSKVKIPSAKSTNSKKSNKK